MSDHKSQSNDHAELSIDRATLEAIAYRLKHAAGMYLDAAVDCGQDLVWQNEHIQSSDQCLEYANLLLGYARSSCDDKPITDAYKPAMVAETWTDFEPDKCLAKNQPEDEYEPVYATLHFYYNDPDSMRRFRLCNQAEDTRLALWEYDNKLRAFAKYGVEHTVYEGQEPEEVIRMVRELFHSYLNDYGIDLTED